MESARLFIFASDGDWETASDDILGGVSGTLRKLSVHEFVTLVDFSLFFAPAVRRIHLRANASADYIHDNTWLLFNKFHIKNVIKRGRSAYLSIVVSVQ